MGTLLRIMKDLGTKKRILIARAGRNGAASPVYLCTCKETHRPHLGCDKLQRQLASEEVLGTREGVAAFAKWAPAKGLFHRRYGTFGTAEEGEEDGA